jgi:hypothetical protein
VTTVAETPEQRVARLHREAAASYATGEDARAWLTRDAKKKEKERKEAERKRR